MADKKKEDSKRQDEPKDLNSSVYALHAKGVSPADNAEQHNIDSREVLAIIQAVQEANRDK